MGYTETAWTAAKKRYTDLTNKKKPGAKFLGVFTKPSGLEPLFKTFDALRSVDFVNRRKNLDAIRVKAHAYLTILDQAATADAASNKDATVKQNLATANKTLRADVDALLAHVEAEYAHDLAEYKVQLGKGREDEAEASKQKKGAGRGMINFGGENVVAPQELVAAVKKADAALLALSSNRTPANYNKVVAPSIMELHNALAKRGQEFDPEYRALNPFITRVPETYDKARMDNQIDQVSIAIKRTKAKLKI